MHHRVLGSLALSVLLASHASAQDPSFVQFGQGCGGAGGFSLPSLDGADGSLPTIDDRFSVRLTDLPFRTASQPGAVLVLLGFSSTQWLGIPLPMDLSSVGAPGCTWYASGHQVFAQAYSGETADWVIDIPNEPTLIGAHFFNQGLVIEPGVNPLGLMTTNAGEGIIGLNRGPQASILFPPASSLTNSESVIVRGTSIDQDGILEVRVNGQLVSTTDGFANWQIELPLARGTTVIMVQTVDGLGFINQEAALAVIESQARMVSPEALAFDPRSFTAYVGTSEAIISVDLHTGNRRIFSDANHGTGTVFRNFRGFHLDGSRLLATAIGYTSPPALVTVDIATGNRQMISGFGRGTGPSLNDPWGLTQRAGEALLVVQGFDQLTNRFFGEILGVNLVTGNRRVILSGNNGDGDRLIGPLGIALNGGQAVVTDPARQAIFNVNLLSGDFEVLSGGFNGSGPTISNPSDIIIDGDRALVVQRGSAAIHGVSLTTGNRTIVSDASRGNGPGFVRPSAITEAGSEVLVTDLELEALFSVNKVTGDRTLISKSSVGTGPRIRDLTAIKLSENRLLALDSVAKTIVQIDRQTGNRRVLTGPDRGTGPGFVIPTDFAVDGNRAYVVDRNLDAIIEVDLQSGNRRILSDATTGSGPRFDWPVGIALQGTQAFVIDRSRQALIEVDLTSGERRVISDHFSGSGPSLTTLDSFVLDGNRALIADAKGLLPPDLGPEILAVDLITGDRTILSDDTIGTGPPLPFIGRLILDRDRLLLSLGNSIIAIDTLTGNRSQIISVKPGTDTIPTRELAVDGDQLILIGREIVALDLQTGEHVILSK